MDAARSADREYVKQPDLGHGTSRIGVGGGWRNHRAFEEVNIRAAYHDLLDPEPGFTPDAQIEVMSFALRHYHHQSQARVERFSPLNILSLAPMDSLSQVPSWKVKVGMQTIRSTAANSVARVVFSTEDRRCGRNAAVQARSLFAFAEAEANYSVPMKSVIESGRRDSRDAGGCDGCMEALLLAPICGMRSGINQTTSLVCRVRYTLSQNWALRLEYNHRDHDNDVVFSVQAFF